MQCLFLPFASLPTLYILFIFSKTLFLRISDVYTKECDHIHCSSVLLYCCDRTDQSNWRRKGCIPSCTSKYWPIAERSRIRNSRQEPGFRNWNRDHGGMWLTGLFPLTCSAIFLTQPRSTCPGITLPTMGWSLYQLTTNKMLHRHVHRPIWWRQSLSWGWFPLAMCQVDNWI